MTRLCQEGHIFKMLLFGGNGFRNEALPNINIQTLQYYGITKQSFQALVFSLRTNNPNAAYKYRFVYESIGGFKTIDKHHIKRMKKKKEKSQEVNNSLNSSTRTYRTTINLLSDDEESSPV
jgi:protease II